MPAEVLNSARPTIQLLVNMNERRTKSQAGKEKSTMKNDERKKPFVTGVRPSQARNTEAVSGSCEVCGSDEWDTDVRRGETNCAVCGFVAAQNMIDPGAEWVNYSDGANRSRVGAPTTLTLSDKGLSSEISRID